MEWAGVAQLAKLKRHGGKEDLSGCQTILTALGVNAMTINSAAERIQCNAA